MSIKYAILGILSNQPQTGYDLKKVFADSPALYWSGNNNQIYRTLSDLLEEGLVTKLVQLQEKLPAKGLYSITDQGRAELRRWVLSMPEPPELRSVFLIQLMWADQLGAGELDTLLQQYEHEVQMQVLLHREKARRGQSLLTAQTPRQARLWELVTENIIGFYERELAWAAQVRREMGELT